MQCVRRLERAGSGSGKLVAGSWETGRRREAGSWKLEAGNWKQEARSSKQLTKL